MPAQQLAGALLVLNLLLPRATQSAAVTIDGALDPDYGVALSTQTIGTQAWADANSGLVGPANGSELDEAFGFISDGTLHLFLAGNLICQGNPVDYGLFTSSLYLFIDSKAGGQNRMRADNADLDNGALNRMAGLTFDAGFEPDYWLGCRGTLANFYDPASLYTLYALQAALLTGGAGAGALLGTTGAGGPGVLSGGSNPDGILVTIDNRNTAGVAFTCDASSGTGVTTGLEWDIPLAAARPDASECTRWWPAVRPTRSTTRCWVRFPRGAAGWGRRRGPTSTATRAISSSRRAPRACRPALRVGGA
jgi:hypothetical protein